MRNRTVIREVLMVAHEEGATGDQVISHTLKRRIKKSKARSHS